MTNSNTVNSVFSINGTSEGHIAAGAGQETVGDMLKHYPLVKRGVTSIVVLRGFIINGVLSPFNPGLYAKVR